VLVERFDAAYAAAVADAHGMAAMITFGPRLLAGEEHHDDELLALLESLAALAAHALGAFSGAAAERPATTRSDSRAARSLEALRDRYPALGGMIGVSPALLETCQDLVAVAGTRFPVLLTGESGVGKELAARAIHELSDRASADFEVVDCGSIPRELIESELFGHVRGAFTGAHRDRRGAFELAHRGTLFLDEIGEMPLQLQTRLLRVLQEGRFRRVGDEHVIDVDVRVIAATNRDLRAEVQRRRFREDLYYRLNVFAVRIPPLRERAGDVPSLMRHFLASQGRELGVREWHVDAPVLKALEAHAWPGNVRELANLCAGLGVRARDDGRIGIEVLDQVWRRQHPGEEPPWRETARPARDQMGEWVLEQARAARFNLIDAARALKRRKRAGQLVPLHERSALSYYLTGEILRALAACGGDPEAAARHIAGDEELVERVRGRVRKVFEALRADNGSPGKSFSKLPAGYEDALQRASRLASR
jgi:transcriptional regulator with GAF, ATPase, and Fis domain